MKARILCIALTLTLILLATSCASKVEVNDEYYGGESMNAEILSEIAESIFNESSDISGDNTSSEESERKAHDGIYYWTDSGSVYHKWADCGHIKNSQNIKSGILDDAILAGKLKLCSSCEKNG